MSTSVIVDTPAGNFTTFVVRALLPYVLSLSPSSSRSVVVDQLPAAVYETVAAAVKLTLVTTVTLNAAVLGSNGLLG